MTLRSLRVLCASAVSGQAKPQRRRDAEVAQRMEMNRTLKQLMDLQNRVALITGGAGHIGRVLAESLAELGASIGVLDIDQAAADTVAADIAANNNVKASGLAIDLTDIDAVKEAPARVVEEFGRLDIVIHSAA